jgi:hypothetical protein
MVLSFRHDDSSHQRVKAPANAWGLM